MYEPLKERAFTVTCENCRLVAILHGGDKGARHGILIVVGGPQYRVGSHRQFILLARNLSHEGGYPVLRFDYRGMGDSEGEQRTFEEISTDIRAAVDSFFHHCPGIESIGIFGLCDGATAALLYARTDRRVTNLILVNPWARTDQSEARTYLRHYYQTRFLSRAFWKKFISGQFDWRSSVKSFWHLVRRASRICAVDGITGSPTLAAMMGDALDDFSGKVLIALSGADLTAAEFEDAAKASAQWRRLLKESRVEVFRIQNADHTLSKKEWSQKLNSELFRWLKVSEPNTSL